MPVEKSPKVSKGAYKHNTRLKALKMVRNTEKSKAQIARECGIARKTLHQWLKGVVEESKSMALLGKSDIWVSEAIRDLHVAHLAREALRKELEIEVEGGAGVRISHSEKRAIAYSLTMAAGLMYDKQRLTDGLSTENMSIHGDVLEMKRLMAAGVLGREGGVLVDVVGVDAGVVDGCGAGV